MPCDASYMLPTAAEKERVRKKEDFIRFILNKLVHYADTIREAYLAHPTLDMITQIDRDAFSAHDGSAMAWQDITIKWRELKEEYAFTGARDLEKAINEINDEYTVINRAYSNWFYGKKITKRDLETIKRHQIKHRKGDVSRLITYFARKQDFATVAKLAAVDFEQPLEPQIGFDPDSI